MAIWFMEMDSGMNLIRESDCYLIGNLRKPKKEQQPWNWTIPPTTTCLYFSMRKNFQYSTGSALPERHRGATGCWNFSATHSATWSLYWKRSRSLSRLSPTLITGPRRSAMAPWWWLRSSTTAMWMPFPTPMLFHALTYKLFNGGRFFAGALFHFAFLRLS